MTTPITDRVAEAAQATADRVIQYEREEGRDRDDALRTPEDVREYADRFGWLDDADADMSEWDDEEVSRFEREVTDLVTEALPRI